MHVMEPSSSEYSIQYPDHVSEFEVQAKLMFELMSIPGAEIRGEVKSRGTHGLRDAKTACRFDLVVYSNKKPVCIIEVKGGSVKHVLTIEETRQGLRYRTYGLPVVVCYGAADIDQVRGFVIGLIS